MPVPAQRDPGVTRDILAKWLGDPARLPGARITDLEYRLMRILDADTDIPVPPVLWYEPDPGYLGAPFLVMRRIEGRVPTDMPPWTSWPGCTGST